jgi:hypothetical protein
LFVRGQTNLDIGGIRAVFLTSLNVAAGVSVRSRDVSMNMEQVDVF